MKESILIRFDDLCPTMSHKHWQQAFDLLDAKGLKPLVGVIPNCKDREQEIDASQDDFWDYVRSLQSKDYAIAMHGYTHVYDSHCRGMINKGYQSEFAGHPYDVQLEKIRKGKEIMESNGVFTDIFFAPSHSYDLNTIKALVACGFKYLSDGKSTKPFARYGLLCIPSRDGCARSLIPQYHRTLVFHPSEWIKPNKKAGYKRLEHVVINEREKIQSFSEYVQQPEGNYFIQLIDEKMFVIWDRYVYHNIKKIISKVLK